MNKIDMNVKHLSNLRSRSTENVQPAGHQHRAHHDRMMDRTENKDSHRSHNKEDMEQSIKTNLGNNVDKSI